MLRKQHYQATPVHFDVGDSVMKTAPDRSCKLTPKVSGPFHLTAKLHGNKFKILDRTPTFQRFFKSITSRRSVLPSPLLLCLLPHLLLIFLLYLTLTLLTVTGCGQLNVSDQFPPPLFVSLARSEAKLAPPCCIFLVFFFFGCPIGYISFFGGLCLYFFLY